MEPPISLLEAFTLWHDLVTEVMVKHNMTRKQAADYLIMRNESK